MQIFYPSSKFCRCKNGMNGELYYYPNWSGVSLARQTGEVIKYSRGQETTKWEMNVMTGQFTALSPLLPSQPFIRFLQNCDCLLIKFMVWWSHWLYRNISSSSTKNIYNMLLLYIIHISNSISYILNIIIQLWPLSTCLFQWGSISFKS